MKKLNAHLIKESFLSQNENKKTNIRKSIYRDKSFNNKAYLNNSRVSSVFPNKCFNYLI